ncbi:flavoprotein [Streptomyces sp. NPDC051569]|uniref:flavoprotein n=1 Tax=Streptomyces sp. NPDC051569 TaxID=3365661 RepID=UPI00378FC0FF
MARSRPFLYVVVCAAGVAGDSGELVALARERGWDVGVVATPQGLGFIDAEALRAATGYPVRSAWRTPGEPRPFPPPDAIAVAPATFNTLNKWAAGIADTLALGILCEAYGLGVPTVALPYVNAVLAAHPAYATSLERLSGMGVLIGGRTPHRPSDRRRPDSDGSTAPFRWEEALELLPPLTGRS